MGQAVRKVWLHSLLKLAGFLVLGGVVGTWLGLFWPALTLVLGAFLAWHLGNVFRLHRWLRSNRRFEPSEGYGVWAEIFQSMERRQQESRRRRSTLLRIVREFREATAALPDAVIVMDRQFKILWCNKGASRLMGLKRSKDVGQRLTDLVRSPNLVRWLNALEEAPEGLMLDAPGDQERILRLRMFDYAQGQHLMIGRDITRIQQVEKMRRDFVANVSHELRTPLTVVSGYIETMADEIDEEWSPIVERVEDQTGRMRAIVEDLLTLSRLDSAEAPETEQTVEVDRLLRTVVEAAEILSDNEHEITSTIASGLQLRGSQKDLNSCFTNLVSNAVRYTPTGTKIHISWACPEDQAVFTITDNGPGIPAQHIPRLTERFYRVSTDRSRASGGTGLGLAIVKHVLALHNATLEIESKVGTGSVFRCLFPAERILVDERRQPNRSDDRQHA